MSSNLTLTVYTSSRRITILGRDFAPFSPIRLYRTDANGDRRLVRLARGVNYYSDGSRGVMDQEAALSGPVTYYAQGTRTNLVTNPSFETSVADYLGGGGDVIARDTTKSRTGAASAKSTSSGGTSKQAALVSPYYADGALAEGKTFTFSAYVMAAAGFTGTGYATLRWYDAAGTELSGKSGTAEPFSTSAWTRLSTTGQAPAGATKLRVQVIFNADQVDPAFYTDDLLLESEVSTVGAYFEGTIEAETSVTTTTPHLLLSSRTPGVYINAATHPETAGTLTLSAPDALDVYRATRDLGAELVWPKGSPDPIDVGPGVARPRAVTLDFRLASLAKARELEDFATKYRTLVARHTDLVGLDTVATITHLDGPYPDPQDSSVWHLVAQAQEVGSGGPAVAWSGA